MSVQPDIEAVAAWFIERRRLICEVIEGTRVETAKSPIGASVLVAWAPPG
jgi:hypothetical protein